MSEYTDAVLVQLLQAFHRMAPGDLPNVLRRHYRALGVRKVTVYLVDVQQTVLVSIPENESDPGRRLDVNNTLAGWAFRSLSMRVEESETGGIELWMPLLDGVERVGVLGVQVDELNARVLNRCRALSSLIALALIAKGTFSDSFAHLQRTSPMQLPAEMVWAFTPQRAIGSGLATSTAVLEPAYDLGGDAYDHSLVDDTLHTTIVDAMGHDLAAGLTSAVAIAGCRNARRSRNADLADIVTSIETHLDRYFPDHFVTGIFTHLDLTTGRLSWVNCGHPPPLLLRGPDVVPGAVEREPELPLGLGQNGLDSPRAIHHAQLEPGDRVLLYTDGVTDARSANGERFGEERFTDFITRAVAAGEPTPETLRRLIHAILRYQHGALADDAAILLFEWHPFSAIGSGSVLRDPVGSPTD